MLIDSLRDPIWQFVGAILTFVSVFISLILYWVDRRHKALSYEVISENLLSAIGEEFKERARIVFEGKPVQSIYKIVIRVINSGNVPILPVEYVDPVNFRFGKEAQILAAEIVRTNPSNLQDSTEIIIERTRAILKPALLNMGDSITFTALIGQYSQTTVDGRIVGVREITDFAKGQDQRRAIVIGGVVMSLVFLVGITYNLIGEIIFRWIIEPTLIDPSFSSGFCRGLALALVIGLISRQLLYWYGRVRQFWKIQ